MVTLGYDKVKKPIRVRDTANIHNIKVVRSYYKVVRSYYLSSGSNLDGICVKCDSDSYSALVLTLSLPR
jgi:hypothetical protein